jgi:hypothetical protein
LNFESEPGKKKQKFEVSRKVLNEDEDEEWEPPVG